MVNRFKTKKYNLGVQAVRARPLPPKVNGGKVANNMATATAAGAAAGSVVPGFGTAVGAAVGLISSGVKEIVGAKKDKKQYQQELTQFNKDTIAGLKDQVQDPSTNPIQVNQAKDGVYETGSKEIEVEKDELIFTKTPIGKYVLKADFKDGKTHNKGGENYIASEGDIIFPGKNRKKVMQAFNSGDDPKLESMRMKLPKDLKQGEAQNGLDKTDPPKKNKGSFKYRLNPNTGEYEYALADIPTYETMFEQLNTFKDNYYKPSGGVTNSPDVRYNPNEKILSDAIQASKVPDIKSPDVKTASKKRKKTIDTRIASRARTAIGNSGYQGLGGPLADNIGLEDLQTTKDFRTGGFINNKSAMPKIDRKIAGESSGLPKQGIPYGAIAQLGAAATNLFPGAAEVQRTPNVNLQKEQYKDTSEVLRQQSKINERIQRANARNLSGGNVQNMLANQRVAGIQNLKNLENINNQEFGRSQSIANRNVGVENRERLINSQLGLRDDIANQQNRAARRNQIQQGIAQLGTIGGQMGQDAAAKTAEEKMLKTLNSLGSFQVNADGSISLKKNN